MKGVFYGKWGIIASGGIARRRTLPAMKYVENARIIAIMDKDKNVLKEISEEYDIPYVYDDEDELLSIQKSMRYM